MANESSLKEKTIEVEVRRLERGKALELKIFERLFGPTAQCNPNDRSVQNAILPLNVP